MKTRALPFLLHPLFISVFLSAVFIYFLPDYNSRYLFELEETENTLKDACYYFEDLDGDGVSEKIIARKNNIGEASFMVFDKHDQLIDQWNLDADFPSHIKSLNFLDIDANGFKEVVSLTQGTDSIFLNIVEPLKDHGYGQKRILIDLIVEKNGAYNLDDTEFRQVQNSQGKNDIVFAINVGFGANPRNFYRYTVSEDKLIRSPHLTNKSKLSSLSDLNNDGKAELCLLTYSVCNEIDPEISTKSDYSSWLTVLDHDLDFYFPQLQFEYPYSAIIQMLQEEDFLIAVLRTKRNEPSKMLKINWLGELVQEMDLAFIPNQSLLDPEFGLCLYDMQNGKLHTYRGLSKSHTFSIKPGLHIKRMDPNHDSVMEWVGMDYNTGELVIYDHQLEHSLSYKTPLKPGESFFMGTKILDNTEPRFWIHSGLAMYSFEYKKNPMYFMRYILYLGIYFAVAGLVFAIMKIQTYREKQKQKLETQIAELQLKAIKNQVDPHFIFNAMNTLGEMTLMENKLEADRFISEFAKLMRKTLAGSDKISHTLDEELEYVDSFIRLQQIRYVNKFKYSRDIDKQVDLASPVPKHALYTYVENAIKHGMAGTARLELKYGAVKDPRGILIYVEDNAGGLGNSGLSEKFSTGSGLKIIEQIFTLYTRLTRRKVSHKLVNLSDEKGKATGLRVEILVDQGK